MVNVSVVWGPTQALGIGVRLTDCGSVPTRKSTWGGIKALFKGLNPWRGSPRNSNSYRIWRGLPLCRSGVSLHHRRRLGRPPHRPLPRVEFGPRARKVAAMRSPWNTSTFASCQARFPCLDRILAHVRDRRPQRGSVLILHAAPSHLDHARRRRCGNLPLCELRGRKRFVCRPAASIQAAILAIVPVEWRDPAEGRDVQTRPRLERISITAINPCGNSISPTPVGRIREQERR